MKQESPALRSFIADHQLEKPNGPICFRAAIHFRSETREFHFHTDVHIITITNKHLDVINLLNPAINRRKINTMYSNNKRFRYNSGKHFYIKGLSKIYGKYALHITPTSTTCSVDTIAEIRAKLLN